MYNYDIAVLTINSMTDIIGHEVLPTQLHCSLWSVDNRIPYVTLSM